MSALTKRTAGEPFNAPSDRIRLGVAATSILLSVLAPEAARALAIPAFLASALVLGFPHGAADVLLPGRLWGAASKGRRWSLFLGAYGAVFAGGALAWHAAPKGFFFLFLALTAFHWGTGDFAELRAERPIWLACGVSRGLMIVGGILLAGPHETAALLAYFGGGASQPEQWQSWGRAVVAAGVAWHGGALWRAARCGRLHFSNSLAEAAVLIVLFAAAPVFLALSVYFTVFHASRHLSRVIDQVLCPDSRRKRAQAHAVLATVSALCLAAGWVWLPLAQATASHTGAALQYLGLLALFTVPHAMLILLLDLQLPAGAEQPRLSGE